MKVVRSFHLLAPAALILVVIALGSCANDPAAAWKSPAGPDLLARLEAKTLEPGANPARRAQLFFLWGQELAAQSRQPPATKPASSAADAVPDPAELRRQAIGAFERVIDLQAGLVDESRWNLEILLRDQQKDQQQPDGQDHQQDQNKNMPDNKQNQQDKKSGKQDDKKGQQDKDQGKDQGKQDQRKNQQDAKSGQQDKQDKQSTSQKKDARDLSSLVKDKAGDASLAEALKQENTRKAREQAVQAGSIVPVEKDW